MRLRGQTLLLVGLTFALLLAWLYGASRFIILSGFEEEERRDADRNVRRVLRVLEEETAALDSSTRDWAGWDDTYKFIDDRNRVYLESNVLVDASFVNNRLSLMLFLNPAGDVIFEKGFDLTSQRQTSVPSGLRRHLLPGSPLLGHSTPESSLAGLLNLPEGPLLLSSQPIVTGERRGPVRGVLIWGRFLGPEEVKRLARVTLLTISSYPLDAPHLPEPLAVLAGKAAGLAIAVAPQSPQTMGGFAVVPDIYGRPGLGLQVEMPRDIHALGLQTFSYLLLALFAAGILSGGMTFLVIDKLVVARVERLSREVEQIGTPGEPLRRVSLSGHDELTALSTRINEMVESLEETRSQIERDRQRLKDLAEHDELTELLNRRSFVDLAGAEVAADGATHRGLAMLYIDLDRFKAVNDRLGHDAGDRLLVHVAAVIRTQCRDADLAARVGGDEFALLLREVDASGAQLVADRVLTALRSVQLGPHGGQVKPAASIGIAIFPDHGSTWGTLLLRADQAMYEAKRRGGDAAYLWSPHPAPDR